MNKVEKEIIDFFKAAFCVDGEVKIVKDVYPIDFEIDGGVVELNDSKKGRFYIAKVKKKPIIK